MIKNNMKLSFEAKKVNVSRETFGIMVLFTRMCDK